MVTRDKGALLKGGRATIGIRHFVSEFNRYLLTEVK